MLTVNFYSYLTQLINREQQTGGSLFMAIGRGSIQWDSSIPQVDRQNAAFVDERFRKQVQADNVNYVDTNGQVSTDPTSLLAINMRFEAGEGEGSIRECGLFALNAMEESGTGLLINYFSHPRIDKTADLVIDRRIILNLTPDRFRIQGHLTRYLGNTLTEELHDLDNETGACQIPELRIDRRHYFDTIEQALAMGYDHCAFCFGRELSQR
ncbi:hypothetical protein SAMN05216326_13224 [Nitrosomonas marina]|uniref:Uncharacterized protein n=1 Tax=Nitrosomonas marina TaxID=917 RepID=A0A1I0F494_9PROT|nr:hypothetical protein [Nitrosomonas marina]SET51859.1 hypothetical protein SAMN05216326_13224 [Nitrosomonas marina]